MIRKLLSFFLILVLGVSLITPSAFAEDDYYTTYLQENLQLSAEELLQVKNGAKYKVQIDLLFTQKGEDAALMKKLDQRLWEVQGVIYSEGASTKNQAIISYLRANLDLALNDIYALEELQREQEAQKLVQEMFQSTITASEKTKVDKAMITLQNNMYEQGSSMVEAMIGEFDKYAHREEIGNLEMSFNVTTKDDGSAKGSLNFKDYSAKTQLFNSQLSGHITGMMEASMQGESISAEIDTLMDFLSVDGNMYLLMENLNFDYSGDIAQEMGDFVPMLLEKIQDYAKNNVYIKIEDPQTQALLGQLESLNIGNLGGEIQLMLDEPMLEAYKKDGDMYLLKPTKEFCDAMKSIASKFDPFYGDQCSEGQYNDMLVDMAQAGGKLYMTTGTTNRLGYMIEGEYETVDMYIDYTKAYIKKIGMDIGDSSGGMMFEYERRSHMNLNFSATDFEMDFKGTLDNSGDLSEAIGYIDLDGKRIGEMSLKNGVVEGRYDYTMQSYDWLTGEYSDSYQLSADLTGKWDNGFETLEFNMDGTDTRDTSNYWSMDLAYGITVPTAITGNIDVTLANQDVFTLDMTGTSQADYIDIEHDIVLDMTALFGPFGPAGTLDVEVDMMIDTRDNKNNLDFDVSGTVGEEATFDFNLKNEGKVLPFNGEIEAPSEYVELEEVLGESIMY